MPKWARRRRKAWFKPYQARRNSNGRRRRSGASIGKSLDFFCITRALFCGPGSKDVLLATRHGTGKNDTCEYYFIAIAIGVFNICGVQGNCHETKNCFWGADGNISWWNGCNRRAGSRLAELAGSAAERDV